MNTYIEDVIEEENTKALSFTLGSPHLCVCGTNRRCRLVGRQWLCPDCRDDLDEMAEDREDCECELKFVKHYCQLERSILCP